MSGGVIFVLGLALFALVILSVSRLCARYGIEPGDAPFVFSFRLMMLIRVATALSLLAMFFGAAAMAMQVMP